MTRDKPLVAVNGLFLDHPRTGTGTYTREVLSRLLAPAAGDAALRYAVVGHPEHAGELSPHPLPPLPQGERGVEPSPPGPALPQGAGGQSAAQRGGRRVRAYPYIPLQAPLRRRSDKLEKVIWEQMTFPLAAVRLHADLLYAPYFSLPLVAATRTVVTIHDLIPLLLPEYAPSLPFKAYFRLVSAATRRADAIVTDSACSARDIAARLDVPPERIHVIPLAVDARYSLLHAPADIARLRERLGLPERFILYLGGVDPRKNISVLLRALKILRDRRQAIMSLTIVAPRGGRFADPRDEAARLGLTEDVVFLDRVEEQDKPPLYAAAAAFVYPSRYEGFGLPPLEAMASGTPVLCSNASSLPEVTGDAAILLDPDDVDGWATALARIDDDAALRAGLAERGRAQAARFTWEATVDALRDVFLHVLGK